MEHYADDDLDAFVEQKASMAWTLAIFGFTLLPVISSVFAIIVAHQGRGMIREQPWHPAAAQLTKALALGYAGLVVGTGVLIYIFSK